MIRRKVRSYLPQLQEIYGEALRRDPSLRGKVVVRFVVGPSGAVERAEAAGGTVRDEAFTGAVAGRVRRWTFEPARELPVEVSYPFSFRPPA
jgi:TonB family protein